VINQTIFPNGYTEAGPGGAGLESVGALEGVHSLMLQSHEGVLRIFPSWPKGAQNMASFATLRANGAFLVTASWDGVRGVVDEPVRVTSEVGGECRVKNPFAGSLCVSTGDSPQRKVRTTVGKNGHIGFATVANQSYDLGTC
jgi:alpha-L-fucosidase 2